MASGGVAVTNPNAGAKVVATRVGKVASAPVACTAGSAGKKRRQRQNYPPRLARCRQRLIDDPLQIPWTNRNSKKKAMQIAIIGAGNVGGALDQGLAGKGHALTLGVRDAAKASALADAAAGAEVVILALPWRAAEEAITGLGDLTGKIVIDCINPIGMVDGTLGLMVGHTTSGGEIVAGWLPGARVVKTLNQVGAEVMACASKMPARPAMFMAGDDPAAKTTVAGLLTDLGFAPLDAGMLIRARILEPLAMVWISQAVLRGMGRNRALTVTTQGE